MPYEILFAPAADRDLSKINPQDRSRILKKIEDLKHGPRPSGAQKLQGVKGLHRIRIGNFRVIYQIQDHRLIVVIIHVGHRREVYR